PNSVEGEDLLGERLVLRQIEGMWARSGRRAIEKIQIRRNVHVFGVVAGVGLGEIEDEIAVCAAHGGQRLYPPIEDLVARLVTKLGQRLEDLLAVRLLFLFLFAAALPRGRLFRLGLRLRLFLFPGVVEDRDLEGLA